MMPEVTFIVPTYKRPELLLRCLTSIRTFMSHGCEVIVVDDSQEGEGFVCAASLGATYIKKSFLDRRGLASSRNIGLSFAKGEFVVFVDDDDFYVGDDLQAMIANSEGNDFLCANYFHHSKDGLEPIDIKQFNLDLMLVCNMLPMGSFAIRRTAIRYGFDEEMRSHEDWDFLLRNLFEWRVKYFSCFSIAIDKTANTDNSHQARTRKFKWIDYLSVYSRFPCPRLSQQRSDMLKSMGIKLAPEMLEGEPFINQRVF